MLPSLEGVIPSSLVTCSSKGVSNNMAVSQVFYIDETHVAISRQFLNKTLQNIEENPIARVVTTCPVSYTLYRMLLRFIESQSTGPIFERMKLQLEIIASMVHKEEVFMLKAADIYEVIEIETM